MNASPISLQVFRETGYNDQFLFAGKLFKITTQLSLPAATEKDIKITTGLNQMVHFVAREISVDVSGGVAHFVENPTITSTSNSYTGFNANRGSLTTPTLAVNNCTHTLGTGTDLELIVLTAGDSSELEADELILKANTNYVHRLVAPGGSPMNVNLMYIWYESNN